MLDIDKRFFIKGFWYSGSVHLMLPQTLMSCRRESVAREPGSAKHAYAFDKYY